MVTKVEASQGEYSSKILNGICQGGAIMLCQAPVVTGLNRVSVVSCYNNAPMILSTKQIYQGSIDSAEYSSTRHFLRGVSGHLMKEATRVGFKASALVMKYPMDEYFKNDPLGKTKSDLIFSGSLSLAEMLINPADTIRTMWQAGEKVGDIPKGRVFSHLYKGAGANGLRQFGTWLNFPISERIWSKVLSDTTSLDSHSMTGNVVKSFPQSFQITAPIWIFERLKNELQYHPNLVQDTTTNRYVYAFNHIRSNQGWVGFTRGFIPKVWSNYILVIGANYLLELGRASQKKET